MMIDLAAEQRQSAGDHPYRAIGVLASAPARADLPQPSMQPRHVRASIIGQPLDLARDRVQTEHTRPALTGRGTG